MTMFGQLNATGTISQMQQQLAVLRKAFEDCEDTYQWLSAYALADLEGAPLDLPSGDAQAILNGFADMHNLWMTAQGITGFPTATLPYNFMASQRMITATR
jgi:hypothetical protein